MKVIEGEAPVFEKLEIVRMAQAMASHAGAQQGEIARNIANADTPGFKAQALPNFADLYDSGSGSGMRRTRALHGASVAEAASAPVARQTTGAASPNGNTVSLEGEMVRAVEVRQQHEMALAIYRSSSDILRISLGRQR